MTQEHPITPPSELIEDWIEITKPLPKRPPNPNELATLAARWGADQELEACKEWVSWRHSRHESDELLFARRSKPPSLKEQALQELDLLTADATTHGLGFDASAIRRALESLPD